VETTLKERASTHAERVSKTKRAHDERARNDPLRPLDSGERVWVTAPGTGKWVGDATVVSARPSGRSYVVRLAGGALTTRSRRFLRPVNGRRV